MSRHPPAPSWVATAEADPTVALLVANPVWRPPQQRRQSNDRAVETTDPPGLHPLYAAALSAFCFLGHPQKQTMVPEDQDPSQEREVDATVGLGAPVVAWCVEVANLLSFNDLESEWYQKRHFIDRSLFLGRGGGGAQDDKTRMRPETLTALYLGIPCLVEKIHEDAGGKLNPDQQQPQQPHLVYKEVLRRTLYYCALFGDLALMNHLNTKAPSDLRAIVNASSTRSSSFVDQRLVLSILGNSALVSVTNTLATLGIVPFDLYRAFAMAGSFAVPEGDVLQLDETGLCPTAQSELTKWASSPSLFQKTGSFAERYSRFAAEAPGMFLAACETTAGLALSQAEDEILATLDALATVAPGAPLLCHRRAILDVALPKVAMSDLSCIATTASACNHYALFLQLCAMWASQGEDAILKTNLVALKTLWRRCLIFGWDYIIDWMATGPQSAVFLGSKIRHKLPCLELVQYPSTLMLALGIGLLPAGQLLRHLLAQNRWALTYAVLVGALREGLGVRPVSTTQNEGPREEDPVSLLAGRVLLDLDGGFPLHFCLLVISRPASPDFLVSEQLSRNLVKLLWEFSGYPHPKTKALSWDPDPSTAFNRLSAPACLQVDPVGQSLLELGEAVGVSFDVATKIVTFQ